MPNRLANESSPYLLQHANNPVDWWPWCDEAFEDARRRDVPVFLSIGYSTCYWCHVMERECFEDDAIAERMNAGFVCVKVDREERPDVDELYMTATQLMTGRGGWPMSAFLEPEARRPFYCGTYFPPTPRHGMPSFPQLLEGIDQAWRTRRDEVVGQGEQVAEAVRERVATLHAPVRIGDAQVARAVSELIGLHDPARGGFGQGAPKFPQCAYPDLLLEARPFVDETTRDAIDAALRKTLDAMSLGGIHDHVGGGFHRYSVDERWLVPHFERMLYDQAQLGRLYAKAASVYDDRWYQRTASRLFAYVLREMALEGGGFASAQDAEVNHREGQNYVWTPEQVRAALEPDDADFAMRAFNVSDAGNFTDPHHPQDGPVTVLALAERPGTLAKRFGLSTDAFIERLDAVSDRLLRARNRRDQPLRDDKVILAWNAMMIAAMLDAARADADATPSRPSGATDGSPIRASSSSASTAASGLAQSAHRALAFLRVHLRTDDGLLRSLRDGRPGPSATLEDHAALLGVLARLDDPAPFNVLLAETEARFAGPDGGWFDAPAGRADLFARARILHDGAVPSGHATIALALTEHAIRHAERSSAERAARTLVAASPFVNASPVGSAASTRALLRLLAIDRPALDAALREAGAGEAPPEPERSPDDAVQVLASVESIEVGTDLPATLTVRLRIAKGCYIYAAQPVAPGAEAPVDPVPLRAHVVGGGGIDVYADYPAGVPLASEASLLVHRGEFDLALVIERSGPWRGTPLIGLTYQVCTDEGVCYLPRTVELEVGVDRL